MLICLGVRVGLDQTTVGAGRMRTAASLILGLGLALAAQDSKTYQGYKVAGSSYSLFQETFSRDLKTLVFSSQFWSHFC